MDTSLAAAGYVDVPLSDEEQMFIYQLEIIGLPAKRAAEVAGVSSPYALLKKPHVIAAREQARNSIRGRSTFTREDVIAGLHDAVQHAKMTDDPMAQIAGWREIAKLLGYDKTPNVHLHVSGTVEQVQKQLANMSNTELLQISGDTQILDADFYRVGEQ